MRMPSTSRFAVCSLALVAACGGDSTEGSGAATDSATDAGSGTSASSGATATATASGTMTGGSGSGSASAGSGGTSGSGGTTAGSGSTGTTGTTGGSGTASSTGGTGSSTGGCVDDDGDGVTDCAGDCDDDEPLAFPGNTEVCGDGIDNDCNLMIDDAATCMGIGTWVSELAGDDMTGDGTQQNPVKTIAKGLQNAMTIGGGVDVYVAEGTYAEKVTLVEGISILGGHQCDLNTCTWARDATVYTSTIQNQDYEGVLAGNTITAVTLLDGFQIVGQGGNPGNSGASSAVRVAGGTPTISHNTIAGGSILSCSPCTTSGVRITGPSNDVAGVMLTENTVIAGDSPRTSYGVSLEGLQMAPVAKIFDNDVRGGLGNYTRAINGFASGVGTEIRRNLVAAGAQSGSNSGSSFAIIISGNVVVDSNHVNTNPMQTGTCPSPSFWCGGIESEGSISTITNNVVFGMSAPRSAAIYFSDGEVPFGEIVINGNTLDGGGATGAGQSISSAITCRTNQGTNAIVGRIRNNILLGGKATNRFGGYEDDQTNGRTCQPEAWENNDVWFPAQMGAVDNAYRRWTGGGMSVLLATVADLDMQAWASNTLGVDPMLNGTWHLGMNSMCINAGIMAEAPSMDFEGDARPAGGGVDIGADEAG
jgi:hypothetical protein